MSKKFTLFWMDGKREVVEGDNISHSVICAGYGYGAIAALDFYAVGDNYDYIWNSVDKKWNIIRWE
jgi:hypothetical protein